MIALIDMPAVSGTASNFPFDMRAAPLSVPIQSVPESSVFNARTRPAGKPSAFTQVVPNYGNFRRDLYGGYLQDNYKISRRVTLNLGLRWSPFVPFADVPNGLATLFDAKGYSAGVHSTRYPKLPPGMLVGGAASWALARMLSGLLFGVAPNDPVTFLGVLIVLPAVAALAGYLPARRASRIDPMVALRAN